MSCPIGNRIGCLIKIITQYPACSGPGLWYPSDTGNFRGGQGKQEARSPYKKFICRLLPG